MYDELIDRYFEQHEDEYLKDLAKLIAVDSRQGVRKAGMPFGEGPARVLQLALEIADGYGLYTENWENYLGIIQLNCEHRRKLDILAHLDVVPAESLEWQETSPFEMKIKDGKVYGRGTADDKGPALAVIYALRAIKDLNLKLKFNPRIFLGCGEESGSEELRYYFQRTEPAEMTISPDASFPVINIEKGILVAEIQNECKDDEYLPHIISIRGGTVYNTIAETCEAVVEGITKEEIDGQVEFFAEKTSAKFSYCELGNARIRITSIGKGAHASIPETGNNAITAMLELLSKLPFAESKAFADIKFISELFPHGEHHGKTAGLYMHDKESGTITVCPNVIEYAENALSLVIDARLPICFTEAKLQAFIEKIKARGMDYRAQCIKPHYVDARSAFIKDLLDSYEVFSGKKGYCISTGGLTYCHNIANGVAFGFADENVDNYMHGADEFAEINRLLMGGKIYASAILKLCN